MCWHGSAKPRLVVREPSGRSGDLTVNAITLPDRCDRAAAEALLPEFVAAMGGAPTRIDASAVSHIGQSMLQLLVSARRSGGGAVIAPSDALREAAMRVGLADELFEESDA